MLLDRNQSCLIVVDIQERLAPAMHDGGQGAIHNAGILMKAARRLGVPAPRRDRVLDPGPEHCPDSHAHRHHSASRHRG